MDLVLKQLSGIMFTELTLDSLKTLMTYLCVMEMLSATSSAGPYNCHLRHGCAWMYAMAVLHGYVFGQMD